MPKAKAIGTPIATQAAMITTKNTTRLPKPIAISTGCASHSTAAMPPTVASARPKVFVSWSFEQSQQRDDRGRVMPTRIAATR